MDASSGTSPPQETVEVADRLHSAAIHLLRRVRVRDEELGLSGPRLSALSVVVFAGPLTLSDLAAAEQVRPSTMTRLVDALQREGLVTREPNPEDARSVLVRATATGRLVLARGQSRRIEDLAARLARLTPEERTTLTRGAELIERAVAFSTPAAPAPDPGHRNRASSRAGQRQEPHDPPTGAGPSAS